jgi:signal transduction histidine kinase
MLPSPRLRSVLFDLLVSAGITGLTVLGMFGRQTPRPTMVLGFVMAAALLVRRRWPLWAMAVVGTAALMQVVLFPPADDPLPYDLAVLVGMYSVVKYARRMLGAWLAAATVATGIVIEVVRHGQADTWWALFTFYVGGCGGVWLMAYTMRSRRAYVRSLEERAVTLEREREHLAQIAVAEERAAIARELHDVVAHTLAVMIVQADGGRYAFDTDPAQARAALDVVATTGREALEDMRRLVGVLRGTGAPGAAPGPVGGEPDDRRPMTMDGLPRLVDRARTAGLEVAVETDGERPVLPPAIELAAYRIVQEALTNVLRHAGRRARVTLGIGYRPDALVLSIVDNGGEGRTDTSAPNGTGNGLVGMRERVSVHSGQFRAGPRLDGGWSVSATLPLPEKVAV